MESQVLIDPKRTTSNWSDGRARLGVLVVLLIIGGVWWTRTPIAVTPVGDITPTSPRKHESYQFLTKPYVTIMGSDALNKGFNFFRGRGADVAYGRAIGQFTTNEEKTLEYGDTVYFQPDQMDVTMSAKCSGTKGSQSYSVSHSVKQAESFASASTVDVGVSVSGGYSGWGFSVNGGMEMGLMFGNSAAMKTSQSFSKSGYGYSINSYAQSSLFDAFVDWKHSTVPFAFYDNFKAAVGGLNAAATSANANNVKVMKFMNRFGSHVIRSATFGAKCSMTTFLESKATSAQVSEFAKSSSANSFSMGVWAGFEGYGARVQGNLNLASSQKYTASSYMGGTFANGYSYQVSNVRCEGQVESNICNKQFNAKSDDPVMIKYAPLPIWEVENAGWTAVGRANMKNGVDALLSAWKGCNINYCHESGVCTISNSFWEAVVPRAGTPGEFDGNFNAADINEKVFNKQCVCHNGQNTLNCLPPSVDPVETWKVSNGIECPIICARYGWLAQSSGSFAGSPMYVCAAQSSNGLRGGFNWVRASSPYATKCSTKEGSSTALKSPFKCLCAKPPVSSHAQWVYSNGVSCTTTCSKTSFYKAVESGPLSGMTGAKFLVCSVDQSGWRGGWNLDTSSYVDKCYMEGSANMYKTTFRCLCVRPM